jgi:cell division protein FtsL
VTGTAVRGRVAILVVALAAVALSLAYPVREYIAQRRQIDLLLAQRAQIASQLKRLEAQQARLHNPASIERMARDRLHMCFPAQVCYEIIGPGPGRRAVALRPGLPWYAKLWSTVQQANGPVPERREAARRPGG